MPLVVCERGDIVSGGWGPLSALRDQNIHLSVPSSPSRPNPDPRRRRRPRHHHHRRHRHLRTRPSLHRSLLTRLRHQMPRTPTLRPNRNHLRPR